MPQSWVSVSGQHHFHVLAIGKNAGHSSKQPSFFPAPPQTVSMPKLLTTDYSNYSLTSTQRTPRSHVLCVMGGLRATGVLGIGAKVTWPMVAQRVEARCWRGLTRDSDRSADEGDRTGGDWDQQTPGLS